MFLAAGEVDVELQIFVGGSGCDAVTHSLDFFGWMFFSPGI